MARRAMQNSNTENLDSCLGLVLVDQETLTVHFVHHTLEEYLLSQKHQDRIPKWVQLYCSTYLNFGNHCTSLDILRETIHVYVFFDYTACYWSNYIKQN